MKRALPIYCFNWPSNVGGADTKFVHLLLHLHRDFDITVVPCLPPVCRALPLPDTGRRPLPPRCRQADTREQFEQLKWRRWLAGLGGKAALLEDLPPKLSGWGLSLCNGKFWGEGLGLEAHRRGLRLPAAPSSSAAQAGIIWSSEMMWHHAGEIGA